MMNATKQTLIAAFACFLGFLVSLPVHSQAQPRFYYAIENLDNGQVTRRGTTTSEGIPRNGLILAPLTNYREWLLRVEDGFVGYTDFTTPTSGSTFSIPPIALHPPVTPDTDGD